MNFNVKSFTRLLIHSISRHSNWKPALIKNTLRNTGVYANAEEWKAFIYYALITLGLAFSVAGVIFFFAFNWAYLHKFVKLGIVQTILLTFTILAVFVKSSSTVKNILLMAASITVGALFAVFGQIYQTGANAYDFFLGWTVFIVLWAFISAFPPLWLLLLVLINTTFVLFTEQVTTSLNFEAVNTILFAFNSLSILVFEWLYGTGKIKELPGWFTRCVALAALMFGTTAICAGIHSDFLPGGLISLLLAIPLYYVAIQSSLKNKDVFYLCIIPLSIQVILASLLLKVSFDTGMYLVITLLFLGGITFQISRIISLSKQWHAE
jgi:uncharacterized membrane protein